MTRFTILFVSALAGLAVPSLGSAQDARQASVVEALECLIGNWSGEGTMRMGETQHAVHFDYSCRSAAGGSAVACHLTMTGIPDFTYELDDLWGYDPETGRVHWYTVTNAGETHDHAGLIGARSFVGSYVGRRDGNPMRENVRFVFESQERFRVTSNVFVAHRLVESVEGTMSKESPRRAQADRR